MENRKKNIGVLGAFALSVGTSIGWGSFVVTGSNYLSKAGLLGSVIGITLGTLLMCIIAYNYHYMISKAPDSGGIYSFVKYTFNGDHAFLASWFLIIVYLGILWANVSSIALFSKYLFGGLFQFGRLYSIAGYDVYLGEVLLCAAVLFLVGGLTLINQKVTTGITFGLVMIFTSAIVFVSLFSLIKQNGVTIGELSFAPNDDHFGQIMAVLSMSPWAFIGFESISHSVGSFSFKTKKTLGILLVSLAVSAVLYILLCQISVMAHPDNYSSWYDYITSNSETGITGTPPLFVAYHFLGKAGVAVFAVALFAIIATSIIGNVYASSNLMSRMAEDGLFPRKFSHLDKNGIPAYARLLIILITFASIFLGRSAIGFIVDVNNIGGVIVYAYVSVCALCIGRRNGFKRAKIFGALGFLSALIFGISHIVPVFTSSVGIAKETFIVFVIFSLIGFALFVLVLKRDAKGSFGNSSVVWVGFSIMIAFFSGTWIIERSKNIHGSLMSDIKDYYASLASAPPDDAVLAQMERQADRSNMTGITTLFVIVSVTLILLFITLYFVKENEKKHKKQLEMINYIANRDPLTGVKNQRAYIENEKRILAQTNADANFEFGLVVCDVNDLKYVNDRFGHDSGDVYLKKACQLICGIYKRSPVFRIGGDEFVVIIEGEDFAHRAELLAKLRETSLGNAGTEDGAVVASGMAVREKDEDFHAVFRRADENMYVNKKELKEKRPNRNSR